MKSWCYQHGLQPRLLWPWQMYEIEISRVERIQQYSNKYRRKWLRVPYTFSKVGLYTNSRNLQLPISSLVEEFKIGKVRLHMMMKDSADEIIRKAYPEIKSGTKWSAVKGRPGGRMQPTNHRHRRRHSSQSSWAGYHEQQGILQNGPKWKQRHGERRNQDVWRTASAVTQAKQCAWTKWNDIEPIKSWWKSLITREPLAISFLLRFTYDL